MKDNMKGNIAVLLVWFLFGLFIGGFLFEYSFEYWATFFKGTPVDIPFAIAILGGLVLSGITLPIAFVTFLCSCFM